LPQSAASHEDVVARIAGDVRARIGRPGPVRVAKDGVSHLVPIPRDPRLRAAPIRIGPLRRILAIDPANRLCTAQAGVRFDELVRATLPHGLRPTVVPELMGITVGGAVAGGSVESTSHLAGGFHDGCLEYEIVTGRGEILRVSPETDPLAFEMIHGSYGTLGVLTKLSFRLVPAKPFVRVEYHRFASFEAFAEELFAWCRAGDAEFIDAIVHGPRAFVLCLGWGVDRAPYQSSYRRLRIYHESTTQRGEDYLSAPDYFFRYDADCHWITRRFPPLTWRPVRLLAGGSVLGSGNLIRWGRRLAPLLALRRRPDVVCDVFVPARRLADFHAWYARVMRFYPLWMVPYRMPRPYPWIRAEHAAKAADDLFVDCAVYGMKNDRPDVDCSELLERETYELGGIKALISQNHYDRERFWSIYDRPRYEEIKRRLDPEGVFGDLYEKVCRRA
jgi:FAD/FMN-containing dehydrogenase